jgi:hypothetical protein
MSDQQDRPPTRGIPRMRGYGYVDSAAVGIETVEVFCQEALHAEIRFDFPIFGKVEGVWAPLPPAMQPKRLRSRDHFMAAIDTATGERVRLPSDTKVAFSYNFKCDVCGLTVPASSANLQPILGGISAANFGVGRTAGGGPSITLVELKARLNRRTR